MTTRFRLVLGIGLGRDRGWNIIIIMTIKSTICLLLRWLHRSSHHPTIVDRSTKWQFWKLPRNKFWHRLCSCCLFPDRGTFREKNGKKMKKKEEKKMKKMMTGLIIHTSLNPQNKEKGVTVLTVEWASQWVSPRCWHTVNDTHRELRKKQRVAIFAPFHWIAS